MKMENVAKMLKCCGNEDIITMKAEDTADTVTFCFESPSAWFKLDHLQAGPRMCCCALLPLSPWLPLLTHARHPSTPHGLRRPGAGERVRAAPA